MTSFVLLAASLMIAPAHGAESVLLLRVADTAGHPLPSATVYFVGEGDRHRVEAAGGTWRGNALVGRDQTVQLVKGSTVTFYAAAPGFVPQRLELVLEKPSGNELRVTLAPRAAVASGASPVAQTALAAERAWTAAESAWAASPSAEAAAASGSARRAVAAAARAWSSSNPPAAERLSAYELCAASDDHPETCPPG